MIRILLWFALFGVFISAACTSASGPSVKNGTWRATLTRDGQTLPFLLDIQANPDQKTYTVYSINGTERLRLDTAYVENDSLHIPMQLFESDLVAKVEGDRLSGVWKRSRLGQVVGTLPFAATHGDTYRFFKEENQTSDKSAGGKWATLFRSSETQDSTVAVGVFEQKGPAVQGTFLTPTGDYRYLAGSVRGDSLYLSCFDGNHAFLFKAAFQPDGSLKGGFWSGVTDYESWTARRDANAQLPDATKLTYLKPGYETISFSFPNAEGEKVSLSDARFKNKVVILQIMGSWCPNCMDETNFLSPWYKQNRDRGVEIAGLSFERSTRLEDSAPKLRRMVDRYDIEYPVLLAGQSEKDSAALALPMLNHIMSFPTTIFIDKKGKVREIHTGFSGPGTGHYYDEFVEDFNRLVDKLVSEK
ncbi:TlpA disulfide reductase family protein [Telluribacter sp.]|jgi:peroxiredoxin|uniref:peroxiredoxin family protein n=1 Tax=Telluribacter sp. TaxID=1978767 RepID=UPI002E1009CA|nr:TlpA disulfide reductase family protein [Telluribacter sp.]